MIFKCNDFFFLIVYIKYNYELVIKKLMYFMDLDFFFLEDYCFVDFNFGIWYDFCYMYIDCVMFIIFYFVFEINNNDEDKEFEKFRLCL